MTDPTPHRCTSLGGGLVAVAGLLEVLQLSVLEGAGGPAIDPVSAVALAVGIGALTFGGRSIVGSSRIGRFALMVVGVAPLLQRLPLASLPPVGLVVAGTTVLAIVTVATVVAAVAVARARILHGVARWTLVAVAADALLAAALSTVQLEGLASVFLGLHLELTRPLALLVWGGAVALHGRASAIRSGAATVDEAWRSSTEIGGTTADAPVDRTAHR